MNAPYDTQRKRSIPATIFMIIMLLAAFFGSGSLPAETLVKRNKVMIEPDAGSWQTWVLDSGDQLRLPAPPNLRDSRKEVEVLLDLAEDRDEDDLARIAYWNAGSPVYRWNRLAVDAAAANNLNTLITNRHLALLNTTLADAMVAAWDTKYTYDRRRPSELSPRVKPVIDVPNSPSYPSEHAVAAGAAARILAYVYPSMASQFAAMEQESAQAFLLTGTQYPSDIEAGLELGHQVAEIAIARAMTDGSDLPWTGTVPTDPKGWTGQNPAIPQAAQWLPWVLESPDEFRPAPPFAYDSDELEAEMQYLRDFQRDGKMTAHAFFWEYGAGGARNYWFWNDHLSRMTLEADLDDNAPRAARGYALMNVALMDATISCWDAKYTYWAIRPFQFDPNFKPLMTSPNHPGYPSAHSCLSVAAADVLAYLFPTYAAEFSGYATAAGDSRVWAGIHFQNDIVAGNQIGHDVAGKVIDRAQNDGSAE